MRARWLLVLAGLVVAVACAEHLPRAFDEEPSDASMDAPASVDAGADAEAGPPCEPAIAFTSVTTTVLAAPVEAALAAGHLYVLEQGGRALRVEDDGSVSVFLDASSVIVAGGETGLLGMAFHPQFATNGFVYLYYTVPYPTQPPPDAIALQSALVRYQSKDGGHTLDPTTAKRIMTVDQPYTSHKGGTIRFGNDGFLYWGLGDGGSEGDPAGNGQNTQVLLGKMLRIDVDHADPYSVPPSNPYASGAHGKPEIFADGLRNPYRWRFDDQTGDLWVGDVGQDLHEEIDKVTLGGNYGWNVREGKSCYDAPTCPDAGFIDPIVAHTRDEAVTIIGGVVYRGTAIPALTGKYVYGDFGLKKYYTIPIDDPAPTPVPISHGNDTIAPSSFTLDQTGEIVVTDYNGGLYRITASTCRP